jgi:hypothetical protein
MRPLSDTTRFEIPDPLWRLLRECETFCVGGCCGRKAFDFQADVVRNCVTMIPRDLLPVARQQLDDLITALRAIAGPVDTLTVKDDWTGPQAANWFCDFRAILNSVLCVD